MKIFKRIVIGFCALTVAAGCNNSESENSTSVPEDTETLTTIPSGAEVSNCTESPAAPSFCDWVSSVDAIIWGEIVDVRMVQFPAALVTDFSQTSMDCEGPVDAALELVIEVSEVYHGSPPAQLTVKVGHHQLDEWEPRPALSPGGELVWLGGSPALEMGHQVGMALHRAPNGADWGLMGEVFFGQTNSGTLVVQERAFCQEPAPVGLAGMRRDQLGDSILGCPSQASASAQTRAQGIGNMWSETSWAYAGLCHQGGVRYSD